MPPSFGKAQRPLAPIENQEPAPSPVQQISPRRVRPPLAKVSSWKHSKNHRGHGGSHSRGHGLFDADICLLFQMLGSTSKAGWGGRIRTCGCRYQKPVPYHLATPQHGRCRALACALPIGKGVRAHRAQFVCVGGKFARLFPASPSRFTPHAFPARLRYGLSPDYAPSHACPLRCRAEYRPIAVSAAAWSAPVCHCPR